jgi:hypothetical protein
VVGYYSLAAGAVTHEIAPGRVRRNMPAPVPVRDEDLVRRFFGDAILRTAQVAEIAGIRGMLVQALTAL